MARLKPRSEIVKPKHDSPIDARWAQLRRRPSPAGAPRQEPGRRIIRVHHIWLRGMLEIAAYLGYSRRSLLQFHQRFPLPLRQRKMESERIVYFSRTDWLDDWMMQHTIDSGPKTNHELRERFLREVRPHLKTQGGK